MIQVKWDTYKLSKYKCNQKKNKTKIYCMWWWHIQFVHFYSVFCFSLEIRQQSKICLGEGGETCVHKCMCIWALTCTCSGNDHSDPNATFYRVNDITSAMFPKTVSCGKLIPVKGSTIQRCQQTAKIIYIQPTIYTCVLLQDHPYLTAWITAGHNKHLHS